MRNSWLATAVPRSHEPTSLFPIIYTVYKHLYLDRETGTLYNGSLLCVHFTRLNPRVVPDVHRDQRFTGNRRQFLSAKAKALKELAELNSNRISRPLLSSKTIRNDFDETPLGGEYLPWIYSRGYSSILQATATGFPNRRDRIATNLQSVVSRTPAGFRIRITARPR